MTTYFLTKFVTYKYKYRADIFPTYPPKYPWFKTDHFFDVSCKIICSVNPTNSGSLHENYEENSEARTINVEHVHKINTALYKRIDRN